MNSEQIPTVNWPDANGKYKFIQLELYGNPHLLFDKKYELHRDTLRKFLDSHEVDYKKISTISGCEGPGLISDIYRVSGMGKAFVDVDEKKASFDPENKSYDYDIGVDKAHLKKIKLIENEWKLSLKQVD